MRFRFSPRITIFCLILAALMVRLSVWQWHRHLQKLELISELDARLKLPIERLSELLSLKISPEQLLYRRVAIQGDYDFEHEMVLRNRRLNDHPGVFVLTPVTLDSGDAHVIVSRGFIPYESASRDLRKRYQSNSRAAFVGLIKPDNPHRFLAPTDAPTGLGNPWVDAWLRVDVEKIKRQLPYDILPYYIEIMANAEDEGLLSEIVRSDSGREDIFYQMLRTHSEESAEQLSEPVPVYDAIIPPGRHLGYVYEWAFLATLTILIGVILQLQRGALAQKA